MNQEKSAMLAWSEEDKKSMEEVDRHDRRRCHLETTVLPHPHVVMRVTGSRLLRTVADGGAARGPVAARQTDQRNYHR